MTTVVFDGLTLKEPNVKRIPKPILNSTRLVSGKKKLTKSAEVDTSWKISWLIEGDTEYAAFLAKIPVVGTLVIDGASKTKCTMKDWSEEELNPSTIKATSTFEQDTT